MIIDVHTHLSLMNHGPFVSQGFEETRDLLLHDMQKANVAKAFVIAGFGRGVLNPKTEHLVELLAQHPNLYAIGSFDLVHSTQYDLVRLEALLGNRKLIAVKLYLGYQHVYPYEDRCKPIYELCLKYDVPIIFHTGDTYSEVVKDAKVKYAHPIHIDEVAVDWPNLKIVIAHMGNPWLIDCAEILYKHNNVYADLSGITAGESLETPYGRLMIKRIQELAAYSSPAKLLYGTDWPLAPMQEYLAFVERLGFSSIEMERILSQNAVGLFDLKRYYAHEKSKEE